MNKKESMQKEIQKNWDENPRWKGIKRPYTAAEVVNLKGSFPIDYSLARAGAETIDNRPKAGT